MVQDYLNRGSILAQQWFNNGSTIPASRDNSDFFSKAHSWREVGGGLLTQIQGCPHATFFCPHATCGISFFMQLVVFFIHAIGGTVLVQLWFSFGSVLVQVPLVQFWFSLKLNQN